VHCLLLLAGLAWLDPEPALADICDSVPCVCYDQEQNVIPCPDDEASGGSTSGSGGYNQRNYMYWQQQDQRQEAVDPRVAKGLMASEEETRWT
jgi:hypothetical protein